MYENSINYCNCSDSGLGVFGRQSEKKEKDLSQEEQRLEAILKAISTESIIGFAIREAINKSDGRITGKLINELKDQLRDSPIVLENVIGSEAIELLKTL